MILAFHRLIYQHYITFKSKTRRSKVNSTCTVKVIRYTVVAHQDHSNIYRTCKIYSLIKYARSSNRTAKNNYEICVTNFLICCSLRKFCIVVARLFISIKIATKVLKANGSFNIFQSGVSANIWTYKRDALYWEHIYIIIKLYQLW